ncbi:DNA-binding protein [Sulfurimonas sp. SAG-AH-194-C20]|nr:DNA-binding protein [Sulfurimonas sp. SAG-AH-194-C20]MDF1878644.1 DNA-binding protein [Sulfurimonas sp. SAG-AH-194-C20]
MKKLSVAQAAEYFGVSKEAIHNRIRRGSLEVIIENGIKMVLLNPDKIIKQTRKTTQKLTSTQNDERYYKLLQEQNEKLQWRIEKLEGETRTLRDQKELMLINEREKIEAIYKEKDEQLKNILSTLSSQFMQLREKPSSPEDESETLEVEIQDSKSIKEKSIVSLKKYLKLKKYSEKKSKRIKKAFIKKAKKDERITLINGKIYLDFTKYDYLDLLF